jgi:hypothetical protein
MIRKTFSVLALVLISVIALSLCSCCDYSKYGAEEYDRGVEKDSVMPRTNQFTDSEEIFTKHFHWDALVFLSDTYILIAKFNEDNYNSRKEALLSSGGFETEPIKEPDYGDIATSFELDGFNFGYLLLSEYPKKMYFIGYKDETRQIAYVWFDDPDLDSIETEFDQFLREYGWECPE